MVKVTIDKLLPGDIIEDGNDRFMIIQDLWDAYPPGGLCPVKMVCLRNGKVMRMGGGPKDTFNLVERFGKDVNMDCKLFCL